MVSPILRQESVFVALQKNSLGLEFTGWVSGDRNFFATIYYISLWPILSKK